VFEAKQFQNQYGFDIGWHKLAYPVLRFKDYEGLDIIQIYHLRIKDTIYLFVFNKVKFYNDTLLLNDMKNFTPSMTFRIDLEPSSRLTYYL
jgi:hypothetical protein